MNQQELISRAAEEADKNRHNREKDPYRLQFHLMPPVGLLNDPNGLVQYNGEYHVFYQWNPFKTAHGAKFWGHYTSKDLVQWEEKPSALAPSEWYEKNGCYSGSAIEKDGKLILFYTGNVKKENNERETYQCMAVSSDGIDFEKKGPVLFLPEGFTPHFRDPKVWQREDVWYMVVGAQTLAEEGAVVLFSSTDLKNWEYQGLLAGSNRNGLSDFGYMWECPDFFKLGFKDVLLVSPQGLEPQGHHYQNLFQSGYFIGEWNVETTEFKHGDFTELDRGFDFYAPQTFEDEKGRRILFGWMGITDDAEPFQPTIKNGWIHALTIPRELVLEGNQLYQKPVEELTSLRKKESFCEKVSLVNEERSWEEFRGDVGELKITLDDSDAKRLEISIRDNVKLIFDQNQELFTLERKSFKDGTVESRACMLSNLEELHIFLDTSSIEIFLNGGQEVFTARFFAEPNNQSIAFKANGEVDLFIQKWDF
jgi:beta-fructofuranosidase